MINIKDRIPMAPNRKLITPEGGAPYYATVVNADDPEETGTPINAALLEDMYGYSNETITIGTDGTITTVSGNVTETVTINSETGVISTTKTDGTKTITMTMTITEGETALTIAKAVS